ncbi:MAG TPA: superoxide dismutase [Xanthomonadales bacterium]|nr:superoxide dismutase [Xanthomonadales bacterium]
MKHLLPPLPYAPSALEPHIDAHTLAVHHGQHHAAYVEALNLALETAPELLQGRPAHWLLLNLDQVPESIRDTVRNNAGGHLNHSTFWHSMSPGAGAEVNGALGNAIDQSFGSLAKFKTSFEEAGSKLFGSGWVWLVKSPDGDDTLRILTTTGHDNPITQGFYPLLVNDVWEHAYYLQHENRRAEYLEGWWSVANWKEAGRRLARAGHNGELPGKANGGELLVMSN